MLIGDIQKVAFIVEKISDWSVCGFTNANMQIFINGKGYPQQKYTTTLDMELDNLLNKESPLITVVCDEKLFNLSADKLLSHFCNTTFEKRDYRFQLPFEVLRDAGWFVFLVSDGCDIKIQIGRQTAVDIIEFIDETVISKIELYNIVQQLYHLKQKL